MEPGDAGVRCMLMRGGTSKGAYFLAEDLPADPAERDDLLLRIMGSPDTRQIDGIGGAHPLTSKVAVISPSARPDADVDYLFLQVGVDGAMVSTGRTAATCSPGSGRSRSSAAWPRPRRCGSTWSTRAAWPPPRFPAADGVVDYDGDTAIAGVPGTAAAVVLDFAGTEGSATGALLPTGHVTDVIDGVTVTCIDNGMPVVVVPAAELGRTGYETVAELEADAALGQRVRALRLAAGQLMGLGDVSAASVPKISLVAAPADGGTICTRTFIPVRVHDSIGVLGAVSVATALLLDGAAGADLAAVKPGQARFDIEHPTGHLEVEAEVDQASQPPAVIRSGVVRTARKLFDGTVFPGGPGDEPAEPFRAAAATRPPLHDVAHLGHIELLTPKLCESLWFFVEVLGLTETGREGNSIYLRTWDDYEHHTVKLTAHDTSGIRRVGLRASSQAALEAGWRRSRRPGSASAGRTATRASGPPTCSATRTGTSWSCTGKPSGTRRPDELKPSLKNQAQAYPGRGVCVRRLDHVNYLAQDVPPNGEFVRDVLGGRVTEQIMLDDGTISAQWLHFTNKGYDLVYTRDWTGTHRAAAPRRVRARHPGGHPARRGHLPGPRRVHRDRAAQARDPADVLPVRLRAGRQPDRAVQPGRPAGAGAGLAHDHLDRGRAGQGPGVGPEDDRVLPHPRDPAVARLSGRRAGPATDRTGHQVRPG